MQINRNYPQFQEENPGKNRQLLSLSESELLHFRPRMRSSSRQTAHRNRHSCSPPTKRVRECAAQHTYTCRAKCRHLPNKVRTLTEQSVGTYRTKCIHSPKPSPTVVSPTHPPLPRGIQETISPPSAQKSQICATLSLFYLPLSPYLYSIT